MKTITSIIMAAKGGSGLESQEKKLYSFPFVEGIYSAVKELVNGNSIKEPLASVDSVDTKKTTAAPRALRCGGNKAYVLTRNSLSTYNGSDLEKLDESDLHTILGSVSQEERDKIIGQDALDGSIEFLLDKKGSVQELFLALFLGDSEKENVQGGYLLRSKTDKVNDFELVPTEDLDGLQPTGPLFRDENTIWASCGSALRNVQANTGILGSVIEDDHIVSVAKMGPLLCFSLCKEEAYVLYKNSLLKPRRIAQNIEEVIKGGPGNCNSLPSLATSVAMLSHEGKDYALMGMDQGALGIYQINDQKGTPSLNMFKLIHFLSLEACLEKNQSNYVRNITILPSQKYISFSLRNLYLKISFDSLFGLEEPRINRSQEKRLWIKEADQKIVNKDYGEYLTEMKKIFSLAQICALPHRISCMDYSNGV